ncbi:MAG: SpoIIIAH-like family protein [bacterium]|nr:SpoIIIAH-like family protein [bacterium]MDY4108540.1 SpoIIIAH-like family protein [Bacilli bacterium]
MINKQKLWFLTLFSLILVLSVYYVTMPSNLLSVSDIKEDTTPTINMEDTNILDVLKEENNERVAKEIESLRKIVVDVETNIDDKNIAYEKIQKLEENKGKEEKIVSLIKEKLGFDTYVEIKNAKVNVVVSNKEHSYKIANDIIKLVSSSFDSDKSVTVKFQ